jgi:DNA-binding Lrp family transcriptional regulator
MAYFAVYKDYLTFLGKNIENAISCEILSYVRGIDVDEKDEAILKILGRRAGLSRDGVITGYKALIDYEKTTWPIGALLLIDLAEAVPEKGPIPKKVILTSLRRFPEIEEIVEVQAATFDLVVRARFQSLKKLSDFIEELRSVEGIEETSTAIVTDEQVLSPSGP